MVIVIFVVAYLVLTSHFISTRKVKIIKKVKLADEIYLDRTEDLKFSDLFLNTYKFDAMLIKKYGKAVTAGLYSLSGFVLFVILICIFYYFLPMHFFCFYLFIFITFIVLSLYSYKKNKKRLDKAVQLASDWNYDDFMTNSGKEGNR
ncbi:MAG: hypothetical protein ACOC5D_01235 [Thermoplasmatota archaeon]